MNRITIDTIVCRGCGLCADACPKKLLRLSNEIFNERGYHPAQMTDQSACTACASCAVMCPDCAITVERQVDEV